ncbi:MAG: CRTAC1 family protein [Planctomycetota bacterium]
MRRSALERLLVLLVCTACSRAPQPSVTAPTAGTAWFTDITANCGIDFVHVNGATSDKQLPETMGGGAALFDADEDGDLDLYCVQSGPLPIAGPRPGTFVVPSGERPTNRLFRNDGGFRFTDITDASGAAAARDYGMGVAVGDVNGDGHDDLYLTNVGPNRLLLGNGLAHFTDVTASSGIREERWTSGAVFFDGDQDGDLDLFVTSYVDIDVAQPEWCGDRRPGWRAYCHPDHYRGLEDRYWRNTGDGTFEDATAAAGLADANGKGLCAAASDFDGDGRVDVYVANDSTENRLYRNVGDGTFEDATLLSGTGLDRFGNTEASMGVAVGDVDLDLDMDLFVTGFDDESDTLYRNLGEGVFEDVTAQVGLELGTRLPVGFGTVLADFDDDGDLDLAIANGHIIDNIELYHDGKTHAQRALLYENDGRGHFTDISTRGGALTATPFVGRALLCGDLDDDGDLDLVLTQCGGAPVVLRNDRSTGSALTIEGLPAGTRVRVKTESGRELVADCGPQPSYLAQCDPRAHLGLGGERAVQVAVRSPGEAEQVLALDPPIGRGVVRVKRVGERLVLTAR